MMNKSLAGFAFACFFTLLLVVFIYFHFNSKQQGAIEGTITDELSHGPIWKAIVTVGERTAITFRSTRFTLGEISPGTYTVRASAPNYHEFTRTIKINRGKNAIHISMKGSEVPDLHGILIFAEPKENGLQIEIRLTDGDGVAITNHPAIEGRLDCALYELRGNEPHYLKGVKLFEGPIDLFWDDADSLARYKGIIPWGKIRPVNSQMGILEATFRTPQGDFAHTNNEVKLIF